MSSMPRKSKRSKRGRRKSNYRESNMTAVPRPYALPDRIYCTEEYVDNLNFATGALGIAASLAWRLNSTFDPYAAAGGHQPYGRDQLAALYTKYRVMRVHYEVRAICAIYSNLAVVPVTTNSITFASTTEAAENPKGQLKLINPYNEKVFRGTINLPEFMGQSAATYRGDDSNESVASGNPTSSPLLWLVIDNGTGGASTAVTTVRLKYEVEWFNLIPLAQS